MNLRPFPTLVFVSLLALALTPRVAAEPRNATGHEGCPFATSDPQPPTLPAMPAAIGQDAFQALAEMAAILDADPATDWTQVDLAAFREHLVDMNRVVLDAEVSEREVEGGFEAEVTGHGRTLDAIRRMVPAHARFAEGHLNLDAVVQPLAEKGARGAGITVLVTTDDPARVSRLRGLGFFGFLVAGDHHRRHHRAMAVGAGHSPEAD